MNQAFTSINLIEDWLVKRSDSISHRQLLWISGNEVWSNNAAEHLLKLTGTAENIWVGARQNDLGSILPNQFRSLLGTEYNNAVYSAYSHFSLSALFAIAGTVKKNGILILLTPSLEDWATSCTCIPSQSHGFTSQSSLFLRYLSNYLLADKQVIKLFQNNKHFDQHQLQANIGKRKENKETPFETTLTKEQDNVVAVLLEALVKPTPYAATLIAKRGRGKSWLLGSLIRTLIHKHHTVALVAPQAKSTNQVFTHLSDCEKSPLFRYCAPDSPSLLTTEFDIIIVDEAAAIPLPVLMRIVEHKKHCVFSTTIGGYEGSASGFQHRFVEALKLTFEEQFQQFELVSPMRWYPDDHLENTMEGLLNPPKTEWISDKLKTLGKDDIAFHLVKTSELLEGATLALDIYSLLSEAHYQTTPDDFIRQFDAKDTRIFTLTSKNQIVGAALCIIEGDNKLIGLDEDIARGARRVRGHLTPQYLAYNTTQPTFASMSYLRINRIAILPTHQNLGLGSLLVKKLVCIAKFEGYDVISTSFGAKPKLLKFWERNHFEKFSIGKKADKASGENSTLYLKALNDSAQVLIERNETLNIAQQKQKLIDFTRGTRNLSGIRSALNEIFSKQSSNDSIHSKDSLLLFVSHSETVTEAEVVEKFELRGKKELADRLKKTLMSAINI